MAEELDGSVTLDEDGNIVTPTAPDNAQEDAHEEDQDDGSGEGHDEGFKADDETDDEKRARRRLERRNRRDHQRQQRDESRRQLEAQSRRISELEDALSAISQRSVSSDVAQLDGALRQSVGHLETLKERMKAAVEAQNGEALADAQEEYYETRRRTEQLQQIRQRVMQAQRQPQPIDQEVYQETTAWMARNRWYDPTGRDRDSRFVKELDRELTNEGWDPRQREYWEELDARAKKYLPHRYGVGYNDSSGRRPAPVTGSSRSVGLQQRRTVTLSPERVKAMQQAGVWDDPKARARTIKQYEEWDKANASKER